MNINEVQNQNNQNNTDTTKIINTKNIAIKKSGHSDFSYYVESSNVYDLKDFLQQKQDEENQNTQEENLVVPINDASQSAYIQTFQAMNNELFTLGIGKENFNSYFDKDIFTYNINLTDLNMNDINLFNGLIQKTDLVVNSFDAQNQTFNLTLNGESMNVSYRSLEVSNALFIAIDNASKTGKPVRLDFGQDTSVILKISKDGKLSADFIPNEKAMEMVLKNALPQLKAKFDEENIPYGELNYKNYNQQKDNQKDNNKEKKDE